MSRRRQNYSDAPRTKRRAGYTLLEAAVALACFLIIAAGAVRALDYTARASRRLESDRAALEAGHTVLDMVLANVRLARTVTLADYPDGNLRKMTLSELEPEKNPPEGDAWRLYDFEYFPDTYRGQVRFRTVELARGISALRVARESGRLAVTVTVECAGAPVDLRGAEDTRGKRVQPAGTP